MPYILLHSDKSNKKYMIYHEGKKVYFGSNYENYTIHHDDERKLRYIDRHQKNQQLMNHYQILEKNLNCGL